MSAGHGMQRLGAPRVRRQRGVLRRHDARLAQPLLRRDELMYDALFIVSSAALVLGATLGSFLNALSFRYRTGTSVLRGRSRCMRCGHTLRAFDLIPIFSFLFLGGKCRYCGARIAWQYPLVEAAGAMLSLLTFLAHPEPLAYCFWLLVWMALLFAIIYDLRHLIIPWESSVLLVVLALLGFVLGITPATSQALLAGPALAAPLLLISLVSGGRWMGWSDALIELSLGWLLGLWLGLSALVLGFLLGAAVGIGLLCAQRMWEYCTPRLTMRSEVPFAPFLALGAVFAYFIHIDFFSSISLFW